MKKKKKPSKPKVLTEEQRLARNAKNREYQRKKKEKEPKNIGPMTLKEFDIMQRHLADFNEVVRLHALFNTIMKMKEDEDKEVPKL